MTVTCATAGGGRGMLAPAACHAPRRGPPRQERDGRGKEGHVAEALEHIRWTRRIRAAVLLAVLLVTLGLLTAGVVGMAVVLLGSLLDQALA